MKRYWVVLLFLVLIVSYGQILRMSVWQDDNALFFKLAHIDENAGYLSAGPFGTGPYKYIVTPYILIYKLFGFNTFVYFLLAFFVYFIVTLVIYFVFRTVFGERGGKIGSFLWASGYVSSDGFIRLFNSVATSLSVGLIALLFYFYWLYNKKRLIIWYFLSVVVYFLTVELVSGRTHYLISIVLLLELMFFAFKSLPSSLIKSVLRLMPFFLIFRSYFLVNVDHRSAKVGEFLQSLSDGEFYQLFGLFSTITNVVVPDVLTRGLFEIQTKIGYLLGFNAPLIVGIISLLFLVLAFTFPRKSKVKIRMIAWSIWTIVWFFVTNSWFTNPVLNASQDQKLIAFLGGVILIIFFEILLILKKEGRWLFCFFSFWLIINVAAYSAYAPTVVYESINRYLAHSFFAFVSMAALFVSGFVSMPKRLQGLIVIFFVFLGLYNVYNSFTYQNWVVRARSNTSRLFYAQLKDYVSQVEPGDVFYFDVSSEMQSIFADSFSVASMPETTALAWRYGVDRYDLYREVEFNKLVDLISEKAINIEEIHSFYFGSEGLVDTSERLRDILLGGRVSLNELRYKAKKVNSEIVVDFDEPVESLTPLDISFWISASSREYSPNYFPLGEANKNLVNDIYKDSVLRDMAFSYLKEKEYLAKQYNVEVSSEWRDDKKDNLIDGNPATSWRADRVIWGREKSAFLHLDLGKIYKIDRFVWINSFGNNTPTSFSIEVSLDGKNWNIVKRVANNSRIDTKDPQIVVFNATDARFVRMVIDETLDGDSAGVSEVWVVNSSFSRLDINEVESFLANPFLYVQDLKEYKKTIDNMNNKLKMQVYWWDNSVNTWITNSEASLSIAVDGRSHNYMLRLPVGGTKLYRFKLGGLHILSDKVTLERILVRHASLSEIINAN